MTKTEYDAVDREVTIIANFTDDASDPGTPGGCDASDDRNITVEKTYTIDGKIATITAVNARTGNQTTEYKYGVTTAGG